MRIKDFYKRQVLPFLGFLNNSRNKYCTIIYYHDIVSNGGQTFLKISFNQFKEHMEYLISHGYETVRFDDFSNDKTIEYSKKRVLIAFDDGWLSNYTGIFDYMKSRTLKYNVFLAVGKIGNTTNFLTWDMVREMHNSGLVGFGAHTYSHINIKDIEKVDVEKEIYLANRVFCDQLGFMPEDFCYPYGDYSADSNNYLVKKTDYKRIYLSDHIFSYSIRGKIIFGRNGISCDYPISFFDMIIKGYNNGSLFFDKKFKNALQIFKRK